MRVDTDPSLERGELQRRLQAVDRAVVLVPPRVLRRVIKQDRGWGGFGRRVPHSQSLVIPHDRLLRLVDRQELGLPLDQELPDPLLLIGYPLPAILARQAPPAVLREFWRLLFHARVHQALGPRLATESDSAIRRRLETIGDTEFEEVRSILRADGNLLPPGDDRTVYEEFAALYLELRYFAPYLRAAFFPGIGDFQRIDALLAADLDADQLLVATRPEGAGPPGADEGEPDESEERPAPEPPLPEEPSYGRFGRLIRRAKKASRLGNVVRAAACRMRAARVAPPPKQAATQAEARAELHRLADRLQAALALSPKDVARWRTALVPLLEPAAQGIWPVEARLLYDLQKVCIDHERELFAVDLLEWLLSLGRRRIKRPVPCQREVLLLKHLRRAAYRLRAARITDRQRHRLMALLTDAIARQAQRLRERFRPLLLQVMDEVGVRPQNLPERVARDKLIAELLDRIDTRGFLTLGDLRDAVARNQVKLPDLAGPREFVAGDPLLRADHRLAETLDGVYHRGEVYLRELQRLTALAFGTPVGRFLTRYLAIPFGGAYATVVFTEEMLHLAGVHRHLPAEEVESPVIEDEGDLAVAPPVQTALFTRSESGMLVAVLGVFYLLLLHVPPFRRAVVHGLKLAWHGLRVVLVDLLAWLLSRPLVRQMLESQLVVLFRRHLLRPLLAAGLTGLGCRLAGAGTMSTFLASGGVFLLAGIVFGSRIGRLAEEAVIDWLTRNWYWLRADILPGLVRWTLVVFKQALEGLERLIYTVDEWLRFRGGDTRLSLVMKLVLGLLWFLLTYLVRVTINLFVEPTFNPIKHFPAVTVAAKLIVPLFPLMRLAVVDFLGPITGRALAELIFGVFFLLLPGLAGFLVWEFKENWKLYRATRSPILRPVLIGSHGETMLRLLRPGLHSGTVPKLFARLRQADRALSWTAAHKHHEALHHVEEEVRHFAERELVALLRQSKRWSAPVLAVGEVHLSTNRIRLVLTCSALGENGVAIDFVQHYGWLVADIAAAGWLERLSPEQTGAFTDALAGLYKMAGVDLVREQVDACLGPTVAGWEIRDQALLVYGKDGRERRCDLTEQPEERLQFRLRAIPWEEWVQTWEADQAGHQPPEFTWGRVCLLPGARIT